MKKRALEAAAIFGALILVFLLLNTTMGFFEENPVTYKIDGEYITPGNSELTIALMSEDGVDNIAKLTRLRKLSVSPYKYCVDAAVNTDDAAQANAVKKEADELFGDYTDVSDLTFLKDVTWLETLNIEGCACTDISWITGMKELTELGLKNTAVNDISPLKELPSLKKLDIQGITADTVILAELELETVTVSAGQLSDELKETLEAKGVKVTVIGEEN